MHRTALISALLLSTAALPALAGQVTITSTVNDMRIEGDLLKFERNKYHVRTTLGDLVFDASQADCDGPGCPVVDLEDFNLKVLVADGLKEDLAVTLLGDFIEGEGKTSMRSRSGSGMATLVLNDQSQVMGSLDIGRDSNADAFEALLRGEVDLILTERRADDSEVDRFIAAGLGDPRDAKFETIFAQDAIVVATSPDNPVRGLTLSEAEGVFSGRITNWSELGGPNRPIDVVLPDGPSNVKDAFEAAILEPSLTNFTLRATYLPQDENIAATIARNPAAIGLVSSAELGNAQDMTLSRDCGLESVPTQFNIRSEDYPLARRLYAYSIGNKPAARKLTSFMTGETGQSIVDSIGYASLNPEETDLNGLGKQLAHSLVTEENAEQLPRLLEFTDEVLDATRLSTTFRFSTGSSQLDNKARADVLRVAELLNEPRYADKNVMLVGFTDSIGDSDVNSVLSERRAGQVLDEILQTSGTSIDRSRFQTLGYGETYPSACNTDAAGRDLNRRVEVWIRSAGTAATTN